MRVIVQSSDDAVIAFDARPGETLVMAGQRQGVTLPVECLEGLCGTCKVRLLAGEAEQGFCSEEALGPEEQEAGWILACQSSARSDLLLSSPAIASQLRGRPPATIWAAVSGVGTVARDTAVLRLRPEGDRAVDFLPGQYARINVPGTPHWRSYSFSTAPGGPELEFLIRLLPAGAMSDWVRQARPGQRVQLSGPFGVFFARPSPLPSVMVAGGTGLGPILSMLRAAGGNAPPVTLLYGVNDGAELACLDVIAPLIAARPGSALHLSVVGETAGAPARTGFVTDLFDRLDAAQLASALFYLCGPPPMIDAARGALKALGVGEERLICERFAESSETVGA